MKAIALVSLAAGVLFGLGCSSSQPSEEQVGSSTEALLKFPPVQPAPRPTPGTGFVKISGAEAFTAVSCGPSECWALGEPWDANGYSIYRKSGSSWQLMDGKAMTIDVGPNGPWVMNNDGMVFQWTGSAWKYISGSARGVAVGPEGSVWLWRGSNNADAGTPSQTDAGTPSQTMARWAGDRWQPIDAPTGDINKCDVGTDGMPLALTYDGKIQRWNGTEWQEALKPGVRQFAVGSTGTIYGLGIGSGFEANNTVTWSGTDWAPAINPAAYAVTVQPNGLPMIIATVDRAIYAR